MDSHDLSVIFDPGFMEFTAGHLIMSYKGGVSSKLFEHLDVLLGCISITLLSTHQKCSHPML